MRSLFLIVLIHAWLPALDLTVNGSFSTTEEVGIVFSYANMLAKCTVSEAPDRFKIESLEPSGDIYLATSASGPWTAAAEDDYIIPANFIKFDIGTNVNGTQSMMSVRACLGAAQSAARPIDIIITSLPDRITANSGTFIQPVGDEVTEDTPYTFTFADLVTTLHVTEPDTQAYELLITTLSSGTLTTTLGAPITLPYHLTSGGSFRWQADADVFTRDDEPAIAAFKVQAANTVAPLDKSAVVTFSTTILGVTEASSGVPSTLTSFDTLRVTKGSMVEYTADQLLAKCHGFDDPDRTGRIVLSFETAVGNGASAVVIYDDDLVNTFDLSGTAQIEMWPGCRVRFILPDTVATGVRNMGYVYVHALNSTGASPHADFRLDVRANTGGGDGSSGDGGGGGGGGCGAGLSGVLLALGCLALGLRRGIRHA